MKQIVLQIIMMLLSLTGLSQSDSWTFASFPDFHSGDLDLKEKVPPDAYKYQHIVMADIATFKPEFLLLTGDMIGGMWLNNDQLKHKYGADQDLEKFIDTCADICYEGVIERFQEHNLKTYGCLGDHEIGDQNWEANSVKAHAVKYFKDAFARKFTLNPDGSSLFNGFIGNVPQRPAGTQYENTSYAFIHKNVLIVTVDIFTQDSPTVTLHPVRGTVYPDVTGEHMKWLDDVLTEGGNIDSVDFVIVQSHFPVLLPIRKHQTSHMTVLNEEESAFWQILRKHKVDLYYSGEVHALTPSIDEESGIIQIVHGSFNNYANPLINYLIAEVEDDKLTLYSREKKYENEFIFETTGQIIIDKSSGRKLVSSSGALTPIDRKGMLIHYGFEDPEPLTKIANTGIFGPKVLYGNNTGLRTAAGVIGRGVEFPEEGGAYSKSFGVNPFHKDAARTFACWIRTGSDDRMTLLTTGSGTFTVQLEKGYPGVVANGNTIIASGQKSKINDNKWHHIACTYPGRGFTLGDVSIYIDGERCNTETSDKNAEIQTSPDGFFVVGVSNDLKSDFFKGYMDEVSAWFSSLTEPMVKALCNSATDSGAGR